jgi:methylaspartate mutase epsilon subunit
VSTVTGLGEFVARARDRGELVVQPRMGFADPERMREGLLATRDVDATTIGTITLDSYTRVGDLRAAEEALAAGESLNGYPIVTHSPQTTEQLLSGLVSEDFPVQVRHGSARPLDIFAALTRSRLTATEGGPVSYCLPYGRVPLRESVENWSRSCELFARLGDLGLRPHLETFGGCMLGQLCPPGELVALSVLEALFFRAHGLRSISLSYAQQTHPGQDAEALAALRHLAAELLGPIDWHIVLYAYMGVFPLTGSGAGALMDDAAALAVRTGTERLIVKTVVESLRIPTIAENVRSLRAAAATARRVPRPIGAGLPDPAGPSPQTEVYCEARAIVDAVLDLDADPGNALLKAFDRGILDIPYCLHPDNRGRTSSYIDDSGRLRWAETGDLPVPSCAAGQKNKTVTSSEFQEALTYVSRKYDAQACDTHRTVYLEHRAEQHPLPAPGKRTDPRGT